MIPATAKLQLTQFLLKTVDPTRAATRGLAWLHQYADVGRSLLAALGDDHRHLFGIAGWGFRPADIAGFSLNLSHRKNSLVRTALSGRSTYFASHARRPRSPMGERSFHAVPLRSRTNGPPAGLLLIESDDRTLHPDIDWFSQILGERLDTHRVDNVARDAGIDRERHLLLGIINAVTDPLLLTDQTGKLVIGNRCAEQLLASQDEQSEGRRRAVEMNNLFLSAALTGLRAHRDSGSIGELPLVDPDDGSDLLFELLISPIAGRHGGTLVSVLRNISDLNRTRAEFEANYRRLIDAREQMRAERNRLNLLVDTVAAPIILTDADGGIISMNASSEQFLKPTSVDDVAQARVQGNVAKFSSFVAGLLVQNMTNDRWSQRMTMVVPADGRIVSMKAVAAVMRPSANEPISVVTVLHDLTETAERERLYAELQSSSDELARRIREASEALAQQNQMLRRQATTLADAAAAKSRFLANVSHEFRTPLNAIVGYAGMLLTDLYGSLSQAQRHTVQRLAANARHIDALITDVLTLERIDSGHMPVETSAVAVAELVTEVLTEIETFVRGSQTTIRVEIGEPRLSLTTDPQKLKDILGNLISNAVKFTPRGEVVIRATVRPENGRVRLSVRDTGAGIARDEQDRVFEPFQQSKPVYSHPRLTSGLGLAISRRLARLLGGDITLRSVAGRGSIFTVELPPTLDTVAPRKAG